MNNRRLVASIVGVSLLAGVGATLPAQAAKKKAAAGGVLKTAGCPSPLIAQTDWFPEVDHSELYAVAGDNGKITKGSYTADLVDPRNGKSTGVQIEVRKGGPAVGFQQVTSLMTADPKIFMGYVGTDEGIQNSKDKPTVAIIAPRETSPQIIMWDPATYPTVKKLSDLKALGVKIRYFDQSTWATALVGNGTLDEKQLDGSYDGQPANFVADGGKSAQQGFSTAEPYNYQNVIEQWKKPVAYDLIKNYGFDYYAEAIAVRPAQIKKDAKCLKALVPMLQAGQAKMAEPAFAAKVEARILKVVEGQNDGWTYTAGTAASATKSSLKDGIIGNGPNSTLGDHDPAKVQKLIDVLLPIYAKKNAPLKDGIKPTDVYTNEFIDKSIGLK
jgi:hypothetical protein